MALLDPVDRASLQGGRHLHPAVGLIGGFGFIFSVAIFVHILFEVML